MEDHLDMLQQLRHSYAESDKELENARRIAALHEQIAQLCHEDEQEIRTVIRGAANWPGRLPRTRRCHCAGTAPNGGAPALPLCCALTHLSNMQSCRPEPLSLLRVVAGLQEEVRDAEAAAAPPDPALHERQVSDLDAACRDSLSRIAGLQNEIRYVSSPSLGMLLKALAGMSVSAVGRQGRGLAGLSVLSRLTARICRSSRGSCASGAAAQRTV
jgi:hypothetical protein